MYSSEALEVLGCQDVQPCNSEAFDMALGMSGHTALKLWSFWDVRMYNSEAWKSLGCQDVQF